jgi:hypothetical protein
MGKSKLVFKKPNKRTEISLLSDIDFITGIYYSSDESEEDIKKRMIAQDEIACVGSFKIKNPKGRVIYKNKSK